MKILILLLAMTSMVKSQLPLGVSGPCDDPAIFCINFAECKEESFEGSAPFLQCVCQPGEVDCQDIDECIQGEKTCGDGETCVNIYSSAPNDAECVPIPKPCDNEPCKNNGVCTNDVEEPNGYKCNCVGGFHGDTCEDLDGGWTEWSGFGDCTESCGGGTQIATRTCTDPTPVGNGATCTGDAEMTQACNEQACPQPCDDEPCKNNGVCINDVEEPNGYKCNCVGGFHGDTCEDLDGGWTEWSGFGDCTESCGGGTQIATRTCTDPTPVGNGATCTGEAVMEQACNEQACPQPCDDEPCKNNGVCTNDVEEPNGYKCNCVGGFHGDTCEDLDGGWTEWSGFGDCTESCGGGTQIATRTCTDPTPVGNGATCTGDAEMTQACNEQACPQPCDDEPCKNNGVCINDVEEPNGYKCNCVGGFHGDTCEDLDGGWTEWTTFSDCTESCGGGTMERTRTCTDPTPVGNGATCTGATTEVESCNVQACPNFCEPQPCNNGGICIGLANGFLCDCPPPFYGTVCSDRNGGWDDWSPWSDCTESCGGGTTERTRTCSNPPPLGDGTPCGGLATETEVCNPLPCPQNNCFPEPCQNSGICTNMPPVDYQCACVNDFAGKNCENPPQIFSVSQCAGRKTPIGQIVVEGFTDPSFLQVAYDPPIYVASDGSIMTSAIGELTALRTQTSFSFVVLVYDDSISTQITVIINVIQDICETTVSSLPCETAPTDVTQAACDAALAASTEPIMGQLLILHPDSIHHFIFCKSTPYGICEKCAETTIFSEECGHCIHVEEFTEVPDICNKIVATPAPEFCELDPCPNECGGPTLYAHPDSSQVFCQCQPGHQYGGCHLCPNGIRYFNVVKQCCQAEEPKP